MPDIALFPSISRQRVDFSRTIWNAVGPDAHWYSVGDGKYAWNEIQPGQQDSDPFDVYGWKDAPGGGNFVDWTNKQITRIQLFFYIAVLGGNPQWPEFGFYAANDPNLGDTREIGVGAFYTPGGNAMTWTLFADGYVTGNLYTWPDALAQWLRTSPNALLSLIHYAHQGYGVNVTIDCAQMVVTYTDTTPADQLGGMPAMEI